MKPRRRRRRRGHVDGTDGTGIGSAPDLVPYQVRFCCLVGKPVQVRHCPAAVRDLRSRVGLPPGREDSTRHRRGLRWESREVGSGPFRTSGRRVRASERQPVLDPPEEPTHAGAGHPPCPPPLAYLAGRGHGPRSRLRAARGRAAGVGGADPTGLTPGRGLPRGAVAAGRRPLLRGVGAGGLGPDHRRGAGPRRPGRQRRRIRQARRLPRRERQGRRRDRRHLVDRHRHRLPRRRLDRQAGAPRGDRRPGPAPVRRP